MYTICGVQIIASQKFHTRYRTDCGKIEEAGN